MVIESDSFVQTKFTLYLAWILKMRPLEREASTSYCFPTRLPEDAEEAEFEEGDDAVAEDEQNVCGLP